MVSYVSVRNLIGHIFGCGGSLVGVNSWSFARYLAVSATLWILECSLVVYNTTRGVKYSHSVFELSTAVSQFCGNSPTSHRESNKIPHGNLHVGYWRLIYCHIYSVADQYYCIFVLLGACAYIST